MPKVSVLIPTYNMASFLDEAIESVLTQTLENFELIVMDNASTDNTEEVVKKYLSDTRVHYFKNDSNVGMVRNWNKCLLKAKGEYIKFLNADDRLHKNNLNDMSFILDKYKNISVVSSWKKIFGNSTLVTKQKKEKKIDGNEAISLSLIEGNWIGEPTVVMFRRKNFYLGLFNINYHWLPDWDMWLRQLTVGDLYIVPSSLSYIRIHEGQMTNTVSQDYTAIFEEYYYAREIINSHSFEIKDQVYNEYLRKTIIKVINHIPNMLKNNNLKALRNTINIIYNEHYITYSVLITIKNTVKIILKKLYRSFRNGK